MARAGTCGLADAARLPGRCLLPLTNYSGGRRDEKVSAVLGSGRSVGWRRARASTDMAAGKEGSGAQNRKRAEANDEHGAEKKSEFID